MAARDKKSPLTNLVAGGSAGFMEALICHPLDTIKVRMQLAKNVPRNAAVSTMREKYFFGKCVPYHIVVKRTKISGSLRDRSPMQTGLCVIFSGTKTRKTS
jgi:hypothetical protein